MKRIILLQFVVLLLLSSNSLFGQVKIGDNPNSINPDASLELEATDKGLLIPRVALSSTGSSAPLSAHTEGMIVYNTSTVSDVKPGFYYNDGSAWQAIANTESVDTTDDPWKNSGGKVELATRSNGLARTPGTEVVITDFGRVGIGVAAPVEALHVKGRLRFKGNSTSIIGNSILEDRQILELRAKTDAYQGGSNGAGINLYANGDGINDGGVEFYTGKNNNGNSRMIIAGAGGPNNRNLTSTHVTIGNDIRGYVNDENDKALLNLKNPINGPAIHMTETSNTEGAIAVSPGDKLNIGKWDGTSFSSEIEINTNGNVGIGTTNASEKLVVDGKLRLEGNSFSTISNYTGSNREILELKAKSDAYTADSDGAGINLYGNADNDNDGGIEFYTGNNNDGDSRMIIAGAGGPNERDLSSTHITIGNGIRAYVNNENDKALLNLKNPINGPAIHITETLDTEGAIAVSPGDKLNIGKWNGTTFSSEIEINTNGNVGIGTTDASEKLEVEGKLRLNGNSFSTISNFTGMDREVLELRAKSDAFGEDSDGAGINLYGDNDAILAGEIRLFNSGETTLSATNDNKVIIHKSTEYIGNNGGGAGGNGLIQKNASANRDELQIYAGGDAYAANSNGAGIHLYGNEDNEHGGQVAFLTGNSGAGDGRMIISGGGGPNERNLTDTRVTIGNQIWDYVDDEEDTALLTLKNPKDRPALHIVDANSTEGEISVPVGDKFNIGKWNGTTFSSDIEINTNGNVGIGTTDASEKLVVDGKLRLEGSSFSTISNYTGSNREILELKAKSDAYTTGSDGAGINLYGNADNDNDGGIEFYTGNDNDGDSRMIIAGAGGPNERNLTSTHVTIGNDIRGFVNDKDDTALLNLKSPNGRPALCIFDAPAAHGDIAVNQGERLDFGHWDGSAFTKRMVINGSGNIGVGVDSPAYQLEVNGTVMLEDGTEPDHTSGHSGIFSEAGELNAIDAAGNTTVISPHHFSLVDKSEEMAWSFYSKNKNYGKEINVDMLKVVRKVEQLTGEQLVHIADMEGNTIEDEKETTEESVIPMLLKRIEDLENSIKELKKQIND